MDPMLVGNFSQPISVLLIRKYLWSNASSDYVCPASFLWFPFSVCTVSLPLITESQIRTMVKDHTVNVYVVYACVSHFHETRIKMFEWSCLSRNAMRCLVDIGVPAIVINEKKARTSYRMSVVEQRKKGIKQTFMYTYISTVRVRMMRKTKNDKWFYECKAYSQESSYQHWYHQTFFPHLYKNKHRTRENKDE